MMHPQFMVKIRSQRGETLVEALVAILISSLGMLMLATAISTAKNLVLDSKDAMETYYENESKNIVQCTSPSGSGKTATISNDGGESGTTEVTINGITFYEAKVGGRTVTFYKRTESGS